MTRHRRRSNENSHAILALWLSEKAQPQAPRPESSPANCLKQRRSWGVAVTLRLRIGAKWLQLQSVMLCEGGKVEHETSGLFTWTLLLGLRLPWLLTALPRHLFFNRRRRSAGCRRLADCEPY